MSNKLESLTTVRDLSLINKTWIHRPVSCTTRGNAITKLINEMKCNGFPITNPTPTIQYEVFQDNNGALEMAHTHKYIMTKN